MALTLADAIERHLFTAALTLVCLGIAGGLGWWIWLDRAARVEADALALVELRGMASAPQWRPRGGGLWLAFQPAPGAAAPADLRVPVKQPEALQAAFGAQPRAVSALVAWHELGRGPRDGPPQVFQLAVDGRLLFALADGRAAWAERSLTARVNAWIAGGGIAVALIALAVHGIGVLRRG